MNPMYPKLLIDILGWTGSILYQGMNIFTGILPVIYTLYLGASATTGLNAVWVAMGLFTLGRKWLTRN